LRVVALGAAAVFAADGAFVAGAAFVAVAALAVVLAAVFAAGFTAAASAAGTLALAAGRRVVLGLVSVVASVPAWTGLFAMVFDIPGD
jgi:hypothetical protein